MANVAGVFLSQKRRVKTFRRERERVVNHAYSVTHVDVGAIGKFTGDCVIFFRALYCCTAVEMALFARRYYR